MFIGFRYRLEGVHSRGLSLLGPPLVAPVPRETSPSPDRRYLQADGRSSSVPRGTSPAHSSRLSICPQLLKRLGLRPLPPRVLIEFPSSQRKTTVKNQTLSLLPASAALLERAEAALAALGLDVPALVSLVEAREVVEGGEGDEPYTNGELDDLQEHVASAFDYQYFPDAEAVARHLSVTETELTSPSPLRGFWREHFANPEPRSLLWQHATPPRA
jgi:hypothetical protein